jgi:peptidoglycan/xylan/chitin deacetylase (PgdA/CDA1 family)
VSSLSIKTVATLGSIALVAGSIFFLLHSSAEELPTNIFRNNEALYAETPYTAPLLPSAAATSTTSIKVPILVYHIVRPSYSSDDPAVIALAQTPSVFDAEMKQLHDAQYHVISFSDLENYLQKGTPLPTKPIIISFDDGWSDQFAYAFPILEKYQYTATFFVFTNPIGSRGFLTWNNLRTLLAAGMTIGSHTRSHPYLTKITDMTVLWNEIDGSKKTLEKNLGITVNEFAYPFGQYNATTTALLQKAGYVSGRGDHIRKGGIQSLSEIYELSALNAPTTTELFAEKFPTP